MGTLRTVDTKSACCAVSLFTMRVGIIPCEPNSMPVRHVHVRVRSGYQHGAREHQKQLTPRSVLTRYVACEEVPSPRGLITQPPSIARARTTPGMGGHRLSSTDTPMMTMLPSSRTWVWWGARNKRLTHASVYKLALRRNAVIT